MPSKSLFPVERGRKTPELRVSLKSLSLKGSRRERREGLPS